LRHLQPAWHLPATDIVRIAVAADHARKFAGSSQMRNLSRSRVGAANAKTFVCPVKLMKTVVTKKVPSNKWVVEDLCAECAVSASKSATTIGVAANVPPHIPE
jgi:hypothetical protein